MQSHYRSFEQKGFSIAPTIFSAAEIARFERWFDADRADRADRGYFWHAYGHRQVANYEALITSPQFDRLIRHPAVLRTVEQLLGGPAAFGEVGLRYMPAYDGPLHEAWHRDRPHRLDHPLRLDYVQMIVYLSDVDETTHCLSVSPEAIGDPILDTKRQLARGGRVAIVGRRGSAAFFNASILHTATTRPTQTPRKSVQIYYGRQDRPALANDSSIPVGFSQSDDAEQAAFYGVLNERTRLLAAAFSPRDRD